MKKINNDWLFTETWSDDLITGEFRGRSVRIPHTVKETSLHYASPKDYEMVSGYRRNLFLPAEEKGRRQFLQFDGAAHIAEVYVNGHLAGEHRCGYTGFRFEITDYVNYGEDNTITVKLDSTENGTVPPFGFAIDYLTYGGIYRDVWFDSRCPLFVEDVYCITPEKDVLVCNLYMKGCVTDAKETACIEVRDEDGNVYGSLITGAASGLKTVRCVNTELWSPDHPKMYECVITVRKNDETIDEYRQSFGFRTVTVNENQILINGEPVFLRGLNRHQSYPYIGYAAPEKLQREDARILDEELGVNAVRTSHYPQSHYFLDECDRRGILVFTEIPGWQHIGDRQWKEQAVVNTRDMVRQYRNHPSIIIWGVRINESMDDDELYRITNSAAHAMDPYRPTSGVRYLEKSSLLEDIYSYNDFSHNGETPGCKPKKDVTPDMNKPLLISEANGHMYPTKSFDNQSRRLEHALRHARVLNAASKDGEHAGCFQWCMFDYQTHKDFGSGDRICYHGVMDAFRNPKLAASVYRSQKDGDVMLEVGSSMDIGDYPGAHIDEVYAFTNADEVRLYKNDVFVASFKPQGWEGLRHGPVLIDDMIGELLETQEHYEPRKAALIRDALNAAGRYGMPNLPVKYKAELAWAMVHYKMKYSDGVDLYGKYVGNWGGTTTEWKFTAVKDGAETVSVIKAPSDELHIETSVSDTELTDGDTYDMAAVRIRILDSYGNPASYSQIPVTFEISGPAEIAGPSAASAEGGMTGTYIRTTGETGEAVLTIRTEVTEPVEIRFTIKGEN